VSKVTDTEDRIVPWKLELVPIVAELPTCQKRLFAFAPLVRMTWRPEVVVSVEPVWKMKTDWGLPCPSKVRSPEEIAREEVDM
jgi:hypothetical protein